MLNNYFRKLSQELKGIEALLKHVKFSTIVPQSFRKRPIFICPSDVRILLYWIPRWWPSLDFPPLPSLFAPIVRYSVLYLLFDFDHDTFRNSRNFFCIYLEIFNTAFSFRLSFKLPEVWLFSCAILISRSLNICSK